MLKWYHLTKVLGPLIITVQVVLWQHNLSAYYSTIRQVQFARIYRVDIVGDTNRIIPVWLEGVVCREALLSDTLGIFLNFRHETL